MTGMEQGPSIEASEPQLIIDVNENQSDDEQLSGGNFFPDSDQQNHSEQILEQQAITTSIILSLGLLARECRTAYAIRQDVPGAFWPESQRTLHELMTHVREAGHESINSSDVDLTETQPFLAVYNTLYDQHGSQNHEHFIDLLDTFLSKQDKFLTDSRRLEFDDYAYSLVPFAQFLRTASETYFLQKFGSPYLENEELIPDDQVNHELLREFTIPDYWLNISNEPFIDLTRESGLDSTARRSVISLHETLGQISLADSDNDDDSPAAIR